MPSLDRLLDTLVPLVERAGQATLEVYRSDFVVEHKDDSSPVTEADRAANAVLVQGLRTAYPDVPVLSEEEKAVPYAERQDWSRFFLVDPLDGTKEFVHRNGEFTVNVALVEGDRPIAGVVGAPVLGAIYAGVVDHGAFMADPQTGREPIGVVDPSEGEPLRVVASRSHRDAATEAFLARLPAHQTVACGSSLKLCRLAEGKADIYPRFGPTMEWDTAAAHAVLLAAGGRMVSLPDGGPFVYNKPDLRNPGFVATGTLDPMPWLTP